MSYDILDQYNCSGLQPIPAVPQVIMIPISSAIKPRPTPNNAAEILFKTLSSLTRATQFDMTNKAIP